jgi:septum site-determining protein MinD
MESVQLEENHEKKIQENFMSNPLNNEFFINKKVDKIGKIITVTSGKGGVGKSTVSANIGKGFSLLNYKTLLIDFDIGLKNLDILLNIEEDSEYDLIDLMNNESTLKKSIKQIDDKLFYLSAFQKYDKSFLDEFQINNLFTSLKKDFDIIIIDSPAGIENGFMQSIEISDNIVLVINPDIASIRDSDKVLNIIQKYNKNIQNKLSVKINLVINKFIDNEEYSISLDTIKSLLNIDIYSIIEYDEKMNYYYNNGIPAIINKEEFQLLTKRLEENIVFEKNYKKVLNKYPIEETIAKLKRENKENILKEQTLLMKNLEESVEKQNKLIEVNTEFIKELENIIEITEEENIMKSNQLKSITQDFENSNKILEQKEIEIDKIKNSQKNNKMIFSIITGMSLLISILMSVLYIMKG